MKITEDIKADFEALSADDILDEGDAEFNDDLDSCFSSVTDKDMLRELSVEDFFFDE